MKGNNDRTLSANAYDKLLESIGDTLRQGRERAYTAINTAMLRTNWEIGRYIVEYEQGGLQRAEYGTNLLDRLYRDLTAAYGKGFSRSNIAKIRKLYLCFPIVQTLSAQLSWSHYVEILKEEDELAISFYAKQCEIEHWSVRELKRSSTTSNN